MTPSVSIPTVVIPNTNPFYVKAIEGNIRVCQGCRGSLKCLDGSVPAPPFDMCSARAKRRSFRDANGILRTPVKNKLVITISILLVLEQWQLILFHPAFVFPQIYYQD